MKRTFTITVDENMIDLKVDGMAVMCRALYQDRWKKPIVETAIELGTLIDVVVTENIAFMKPLPREDYF